MPHIAAHLTIRAARLSVRDGKSRTAGCLIYAAPAAHTLRWFAVPLPVNSRGPSRWLGRAVKGVFR